MEEAPGLAEVLSHWSVDVPWWLLLFAASAVYTLAWRRSQHTGRQPHPRSRLVAFQAGLVALAIAALSPIEHYGNQLLWVNFLGFLILTMIAAPLLVLGSPLTLAFRVCAPRGRARLRAFYRSRALTVLTFPIFSWLAFAVVTYAWQFSWLTDEAAAVPLVRDVQQVTLLAASLLFWTPALAADPVRWRLPHPLRALYVFVEMTHKGLFGGMFLSMANPFHPGFVEGIPPWGPSPITDQRLGILILWIGGNIIFLVALIAIILAWMAYERRNSHRVDWRLALKREAEARRRAAVEQVFRKQV